MKKKIAFLVTKSNFGGAQRYVYDIVTTLPEAKFNPFVIGGAGGTLTHKLKEKHIAAYLLESMKRDVHIADDFRSLIEIFKILKKERPDIVHLNSPKAAGIGAFCSRLLRIKKIIYTIHGFAFNEDRNGFQKFAIKFLSWLTILLSHHAVFLSEKEMLQARHWPFIRHKLFLIPLGIKEINFATKQDARDKLSRMLDVPLPEDRLIIGTIAELHKNKGLRYAIEALAQIESVRYIVIGDGEEKEQLQKQIKDLNASNVYLAGRIENAASLLRGFDAFLLPSIKEGLPYVLLEAGFAGLPVIATRVGGIPELIEHAKSGILVAPKSPEDIKNKVVDLKKDRYVMAKLGQKLEEHVKNKHNLQLMIDKLLNLYIKGGA